MEKEKKEDRINDWAYSEQLKKNIHISKAESGLKGYRCLACHAQMVANIQKKNPNWHSYFSHHASDVNKEKVECVRASKVYRENIAREILNRLKYVNAPAIYKNPPLDLDENLLPMKIEGKRKIEAVYTKAELTFYENENGIIKWGKKPIIEDKDLLIRPDVTFFSKEDKPILFIEFIVYSKIKPDKFLKLSRFGIDTLQINIPRKSEVEIEKALQSSRTYKWVYNEKEANTEYIQVFRRNSEDLPQINGNERIFFEEDFKCRQTEINWLIRSIKRSLQSEQYRTIELRLNQQIQKVERNTESAKQGLEDLEESNRRDALARNQNEKDQEDKTYRDLETRYIKKNRGLEDSIYESNIDKKFRSEIIKNIEAEEGEIKSIEQEEVDFEAVIRERIQNTLGFSIERERREIENLEETVRNSIDRELDSTNNTIESLGILYDDIPRSTADKFEFPKEIENKAIRKIKEEIKQVENEKREIEEKISNDFKREIQFEESEIERIREEEKNIEESARREFDREIKNDSRGLPKEFTDLLEAQRMGNDYENLKREEDSYRRAQKFFRKGAWS